MARFARLSPKQVLKAASKVVGTLPENLSLSIRLEHSIQYFALTREGALDRYLEDAAWSLIHDLQPDDAMGVTVGTWLDRLSYRRFREILRRAAS